MRSGPEEAAPIAVQLAHLWQKPTCEELLVCLMRLRLEPPVWNLKISRAEILQKQQQQKQHIVDSREIISFLSAIIKSTLGWIEDYDEKELVWEEASKRLTERCGRTAMGEIIRRWPFENPAFSLTIREPPLTGDSLGLKTWGSSYVLAQLLPMFSAGPLAHLLSDPDNNGGPVDILELGAGTGLLGLSAACTWGANVVMTDLPEILPNLEHNVALNASTIEGCGGRAEAAALTWGGSERDSDPRFGRGGRYKLIIVADPLYDDNHPALLAGAIDEHLSLDSGARVLIMVPQRDEITKELLAILRDTLASGPTPLVCSDESIVPGQDDWGDDGVDDSTPSVGFWCGVFKRSC